MRHKAGFRFWEVLRLPGSKGSTPNMPNRMPQEAPMGRAVRERAAERIVAVADVRNEVRDAHRARAPKAMTEDATA